MLANKIDKTYCNNALKKVKQRMAKALIFDF